VNWVECGQWDQVQLNCGVMMKKFYKKSSEEGMVNFYDSLSEKDRRRYAAVEALKLDRGGKAYICSLLGCDPKTIQGGLSDLEQEEELKKNE
jgi:hypothetical protein